MPLQGTSFPLRYFAYDTNNKVGKPGDVANHTIKLQRDNNAPVNPTNALAEIDAANLPGWYKVNLTTSETVADSLLIAGKSSTAGIIIQGTQISLESSAQLSTIWSELTTSGNMTVVNSIGKYIVDSLTTILNNSSGNSGKLDAVLSDTGSIKGIVNQISSDNGTILGTVLGLPNADAIIAAIKVMEIETGFSFLTIMKYLAAFIGGLTLGGGTDELIFRNLNNTLDRIKFTLSQHNNRVSVVRDNT